MPFPVTAFLPRRLKALALVPMVFIPMVFIPVAASADDLCPKSYTWFSCTLENGKSVSVCGSASTDPGEPRFAADADSSLQYRYGTIGRIELAYPKGKGANLWKRFLGAVEFLPGGTPDRINFSFVTGNTRYLIQGNRTDGKMAYSLSVLSEGPVKTIAEHSCKSVGSDHLLPIALAVPCDPNDIANDTRGQVCKR
jgi:hypothetical protein